MMTVWKFPIGAQDEFCLEMPKDAKLLHFALQHNSRRDEEVPTLWALVDSNAPKVKRWFRLMGTGHEDTWRLKHAPFVGSVLMQHGELVFHLFDLGEK
jgi:hypothetical protein